MSISGISALSGTPLIAVGALSSQSANQALVTSGGDNLQGLYDTVSNNSASWTGGGGGTDNSNTFTIISGVTTNKEVAENSGKGLLFRDGQGYMYNLAGKTTYSNYAIYDFRAMTAGNTCKQCRVKIYPTAESATTAYTTGYTTMLTTNDTVSYASTAWTAYCDEQGHNIAGLYNFVSQNSGSWTGGGGGGDTGTSIPLRIDYQFSEQYGSIYTGYSLSSDGSNFLFTASDQGSTPSDLYINGNYYQWTYNNGRWEIPHQINGQESIQWSTYVGLEYSGQNIIEGLPTSIISTAINKVVVNNTMGSTTGNISLNTQGGAFTYTGFTGSWSGEIPTSINNLPVSSYNVSVGAEYYGNDYSYVIGAYSEVGGTTINSADVFPSTNNLDPYQSYVLVWNQMNGGLQWSSTYNGGY